MRVWEIEGTRVFCFSGMPFNCPIVGTRSAFAFVVSGLEGHTLAVCHFHCAVVVNGGDGHAIQLELRSVFDMAIERRAG